MGNGLDDLKIIYGFLLGCFIIICSFLYFVLTIDGGDAKRSKACREMQGIYSNQICYEIKGVIKL